MSSPNSESRRRSGRRSQEGVISASSPTSGKTTEMDKPKSKSAPSPDITNFLFEVKNTRGRVEAPSPSLGGSRGAPLTRADVMLLFSTCKSPGSKAQALVRAASSYDEAISLTKTYLPRLADDDEHLKFVREVHPEIAGQGKKQLSQENLVSLQERKKLSFNSSQMTSPTTASPSPLLSGLRRPRRSIGGFTTTRLFRGVHSIPTMEIDCVKDSKFGKQLWTYNLNFPGQNKLSLTSTVTPNEVINCIEKGQSKELTGEEDEDEQGKDKVNEETGIKLNLKRAAHLESEDEVGEYGDDEMNSSNTDEVEKKERVRMPKKKQIKRRVVRLSAAAK